MTVISAVADGQRVHMAADSISCGGDSLSIPRNKIVTLDVAGTTALLAGAGRAALAAVVAAHCRLDQAPSGDRVDQDRWAQAFAEAATEVCQERGHNDEDGDIDGHFLFAWGPRLWMLSKDLAQPIDEYAAIGHGAGVAFGAMWASPAWPAGDRARRAVEASIAHVAGIGGPVTTAHT